MKTRNEEIYELVDNVHEAYGKHYSKEAAAFVHDTFRKLLAPFGLDAIHQAFEEYQAKSAYCPKPADILKILREKAEQRVEALGNERRRQVENKRSVYEDAFVDALKASDWRKIQYFGAAIANDFVSQLQGGGA